jgi:glyoxylase-like metal-dependent hydrolase (beta-lactamase superfamily II)
VREIAPGLWHWTGRHPGIGSDVSSYFLEETGTLIDPITPPEGLDWFRGGHEPSGIALTNRHHDRDCLAFCTAFAIGPVQVPETGLHEFEGKDLEVSGYAPGEEIIPGILVHEVDAISPDDMALELRSAGALAVADSLVHYGRVRFVSDNLMDDPPATKRGLVAAFERLLDVDFDTLLFAHGEPIVGTGKQALRAFLASDPAG